MKKLKVSTGVEFKILDVPLMAIEEIKKKVNRERPKAPVQWIENKEREEVNYDDPEYKAAMEEWDGKLTMAIYDGLIILGTEIASVPEGFPKLEENSWIERLSLLDIEVHENGNGRYLDWVKFCAAPAVKDINSLMIACGRKAGVREEDVAEASELFRNREARGADRKTSGKTRN